MKYCYYCRLSKSKECFSKDRTRIDGLNNICKTCDKLKAKRRFEKDTKKERCVWQNKTARRRTRLKNLPSSLTQEQWLFSLYYFNYRCAVCGKPFKETKCSLDHWYPISKQNSPGHVVTNVVPLCMGKNGCNNKKGNKDPNEWLVKEFGAINGYQIAQKINFYFKTVRAS